MYTNDAQGNQVWVPDPYGGDIGRTGQQVTSSDLLANLNQYWPAIFKQFGTNPTGLSKAVGAAGGLDPSQTYQYLISQGVDPAFATQVMNTGNADVAASKAEGSFGNTLRDFGSQVLLNPVTLAAGGAFAAPFLFGGAAGGASGGTDFLSGLGDTSAGFSTNPSLADLGGDTSFWSGAGDAAATAGGTVGTAAGTSGGGFVDPWDMQIDPSITYQSPNVTNMPLPNGGITGGGGGLWDTLSQYGGAGVNALKSLFGAGIPGFGGGPSVGSTAPGLLALAYAAKQPGIDLTNLNGILGKLGGNQDAVIKAATDPFQENIAAGYGDILTNQANRGIRGSSFGTTDIGNYIGRTGIGLANAGANAAEGSLALQGNLATNIEQLRNQAQQIKNNLYGRAFDVLGRGLNPSGYAGSRVPA